MDVKIEDALEEERNQIYHPYLDPIYGIYLNKGNFRDKVLICLKCGKIHNKIEHCKHDNNQEDLRRLRNLKKLFNFDKNLEIR